MPEEAGISDYRKRLLREYHRRKAKNSAYSIRAFARYLQLSHPTLIGLLKMERHFSKANLRQVGGILAWSQHDLRAYERQIQGKGRVSAPLPQGGRKVLGPEHYPLLSAWYLLPVLYLAEFDDNQASAEWICSRLAITKAEAARALKVLHELGLIRVEEGRMCANQNGVCFFEKTRSRPLHEHTLNLHTLSRAWLEKPDEIDQIQYVATFALDREGFDRLARSINLLKVRADRDARKRPREKVYYMVAHVFPAAPARKKPKRSGYA